MLERVLILVILILLVFFVFFSRSNITDPDCPDGSYSIPSSVGSPYRCVMLYTHHDYFTEAEQSCKENNGHLFPVSNEFVNIILTSK